MLWFGYIAQMDNKNKNIEASAKKKVVDDVKYLIFQTEDDQQIKPITGCKL